MSTLPPDQENGYPIEDFIKNVKASLDFGKLRVWWNREGGKSRAVKDFMKNGVDEIRIVTVDAIIREKGIGREEAIASQKTAIIEELCHLKKDRDHTPEIFVCVRREIDRHLSPEEKMIIDEKLSRLRQACIQEIPSVPEHANT